MLSLFSVGTSLAMGRRPVPCNEEFVKIDHDCFLSLYLEITYFFSDLRFQ
jgi:hypothetical protein